MINIFKKIKIKKNKKIFYTKATISTNDVTLLSSAICRNTGTKDAIIIGNHCTLGCVLEALHGGKISIGDNTYIGPQSFVQCKQSISIGNSVIIANNVLIIDNNNHPIDPLMRLQMSACNDFLHDELWSWKYADSKPIIIEDNVWIGRDSRIMKGVTVGKGSIVALGAIVTKNVPPYTVVAGNPAVVVKHLPSPEEN